MTPFRIPDNFSEIEQAALKTARALAQDAIAQAANLPAGEQEAAAAAFLAAKALSQVEQYDQLIPVIGAFLDNPVADFFEKEAVTALCRAFVHELYKEGV